MKTLFGGGGGQNSSANGYSALSPALKATFDPMGTAIGQYTNPNNPGVTDAFTPTPLSTGETGAINNINKGFAPTADSINSDMSMQMNPFNDQVIGEINRQGQGQYSVMKQAMDAAGQGPSSNRSILGANDVDLSRMGVIGQFLQSQFNTGMNNALTTLPSARAADATSQLGVGDLLRQLDMQTKQAPVAALNAGTGMLSPFVSGGTTQGTNNQQNGILSTLAGMVKPR